MRGLFFKVFIIFWIAQSMIFVISTALIVRHHFDRPDVMYDAFYSRLQNDASKSVAAYESGGCDALRGYSAGIAQTTGLEDAAGQSLCGAAGMEQPGERGQFPARIIGSQVGRSYVWRVPVTLASGKQYVFLLSRPHEPG